MTNPEIANRRLQNQRIATGTLDQPEEVVKWLVAVQAQDYAGAKWALGLRTRAVRDEDVERAFNEGAILRTHLLRPTWHFVTPADIDWLLELTAPRVHVANKPMYRKLELDNALLNRSNDVLANALQGGQYLTRNELRDRLQQAGIATEAEMRMGYLMMYAELEGLVCSGPRRGKQFTYALRAERAPKSRTLHREEALTELAGRFFTSRGPATVHDLAKWAGLTLRDARAGLDAVKDRFFYEKLNDQEYWMPAAPVGSLPAAPSAHLVSIYDEYIASYKGWQAVVEREVGERLIKMGNALTSIILLDGMVVGTWRRTITKDRVAVELNLLKSLTPGEWQAIATAADQYGAFHQRPASISQATSSSTTELGAS
jgi:hypothetical protein